MKYRKGSVADVLWFIGLISMFIIVMRMQLEYSNTATIDSYVKNIVNSEATRFVSSISGYSTSSSSVNMYDEDGNKLTFTQANQKVNEAKNDMIRSIKDAFNENDNLSTRTKGVIDSNIEVVFKDKTSKSTIVTITLKYTVVGKTYNGEGGITKISDMEIPRKVVVTRVIENPLRFK